MMRIYFLGFILGVTLILAACGKDETKPTAANPAPQNQPSPPVPTQPAPQQPNPTGGNNNTGCVGGYTYNGNNSGNYWANWKIDTDYDSYSGSAGYNYSYGDDYDYYGYDDDYYY